MKNVTTKQKYVNSAKNLIPQVQLYKKLQEISQQKNVDQFRPKIKLEIFEYLVPPSGNKKNQHHNEKPQHIIDAMFANGLQKIKEDGLTAYSKESGRVNNEWTMEIGKIENNDKYKNLPFTKEGELKKLSLSKRKELHEIDKQYSLNEKKRIEDYQAKYKNLQFNHNNQSNFVAKEESKQLQQNQQSQINK